MYGPDELLNKHVHQLNKQALLILSLKMSFVVSVNLMAQNN
jgi:hypothetical protein